MFRCSGFRAQSAQGHRRAKKKGKKEKKKIKKEKKSSTKNRCQNRPFFREERGSDLRVRLYPNPPSPVSKGGFGHGHGRLNPILAKPTLAIFIVFVFWPNFVVLLCCCCCCFVVVVVVGLDSGTALPPDRLPPDRPKFRSFSSLPRHLALFVSVWGSSR